MATTLSIVAINAAQLEGNGAINTFTFAVNRTGDLSGASSVLWRVAGVGSNPANAADFINGVLPSGTVSFATGESSQTISVDVSGDTVVENNENFSVILYSSTGATIGTSTAIATILSDDLPSISLSLSQASVAEDGSNNLAYVFSRTGSTAAPLTVNYIVRGTANLNDYASLPSGNIKSITFAAGASTTTLLVHPTADSIAEADETVEISLSPATFYTISTPAAVVGRIVNDDTNLAIKPASISQSEGNSGTTLYTFTVTRSGLLSGSSTAQWSVTGVGGNPANANDFPGGVLPTGSVTFAAGETSQTITIEVNGDSIAENDEIFVVTLDNPTGATITAASAEGVIVNDDTNLAIEPASISQSEGNSGTTLYTFTVTRSGLLSGSSTAQWSVTGVGGNPANANDFPGGVLPTGSVTFAAGETSQTITIEVNGDSIAENDEIFVVTLDNPTGATITAATASGTIVNDDTNLGIIAINADQFEGNSGSKSFTFAIKRTGVLSGTSTTSWAAAGSGITPADAGDFAGGILPSGTVTFAPGEESKLISVDINGDTQIETDETFSVTLYDSSEETPQNPTATGTIISDEPITITLALQPTSTAEDGGQVFNYTFTRNGPTDAPLTVNFLISGSADSSSDYTANCDLTNFPVGIITFNAGDSTVTLEIRPTADAIVEADEIIEIELLTSSEYVVGTVGPVVATIINDDLPAISLNVTPATVLEDGSSNLVYSFTRTGSTSAPLTVYYTVSGTASADDYVGIPISQEITFAVGQSSVDLVVNPTADNLAEADETLAITLAANSAYSLGAGTTIIGTIANDDTNLTISPSFIRKQEGNVGATVFTYTVTRTGVIGGSSSVTWSILGVGGQSANAADFVGGLLPTGTINFAPGEVTKNIDIIVNGDTLVEPNEIFSIVLSNPGGATMDVGGAPVANPPVTPSTSLITGLGGNKDFGENTLGANDDGSTGAIDLTSIFPYGLNFFGSTYNSVYLNNNGNITFDSPLGAAAPSPITQFTSYPIIAPFHADVDTRAGLVIASPGGTSTGSNLVYWDLDPVNRQATFTWDDVGKYSWGTSPNAFQLVLRDVGLGNLQIDFRYENITWLAGDFVPGILARAGFSLGNGYTFYELPQSGTIQMGNLASTSNIGQPGLYRFTLPVVNLPSIARGVIVNDDSTVSISPSSLSFSELGSPTYTYLITRNGDTSAQSSVAWQVSGQWGIDGSDFFGGVIPSGTAVFAPGETTKTIQIKVQNDATFENNETFVVNLHSAVNTVIAQNNATGTILNDDLPRRTGGDIHVNTHDGLAYPFQNSGIYTLTKSSSGDLNLAIFLDWADPARSVSFATEIALKLENRTFHLKATWNDFFEVDYKGNMQTLLNSEYITIDGIKIKRIGKSLIFTNSKNEEIHVIDQGSYFDFAYSISPLRMGTLQGLMGNYDGNKLNDNQPNWLSSSVEISKSPFATFIDQGDYRPSFELPPVTRRYEDIPQAVIDYVTSLLLARGITDENLIIQAAYDVWVTGNNTFINDVIDFSDAVILVGSPPPCFMSGTLINTPSGEVPVESLRPGDMVLTPAGPQAVKFLGKTTRKASALKPQAKMPIRINKDSLGNNLPIMDTYCSPSHAFVVDDCLVEARALVNNESITNIEKWPDIVPIIYFSIELDEHQLVWANGLLTETYYSNWTSTGFSREAWDNYSTYLELYQESKPMNELPMARIPFARQLPLRIRERFKLCSSSAASGLDYSREELCLTL